MTSGIDAALAEAVSSGGVLGAVAEVWSDRGTYSAVAGESVVGQSLGLDSMFYLASMTKTVTAVATMQLIERGLLDLEDPVGDMVPYVRDVQVLTGFGEDETPQFRSPSRSITIRQLLTHTAGFAYDFSQRNDGQVRGDVAARTALDTGLLRGPSRVRPG